MEKIIGCAILCLVATFIVVSIHLVVIGIKKITIKRCQKDSFVLNYSPYNDNTIKIGDITFYFRYSNCYNNQTMFMQFESEELKPSKAKLFIEANNKYLSHDVYQYGDIDFYYKIKNDVIGIEKKWYDNDSKVKIVLNFANLPLLTQWTEKEWKKYELKKESYNLKNMS